MNSELKAMACLLVYPRRQLIDDLDAISECIKESTKLSSPIKDSLKGLITNLASSPLSYIQSSYVATFDIGRKASLNLFEHLHSDSRDRGVAMTNLLKLYEDHGLVFNRSELPDFLPAVLEFLSGLTYEEARIWLQSASGLISQIDQELSRIQSPWRAVTEALLAFVDAPSSTLKQVEPEPPGVEADYYDRPVNFGNSGNPIAQGIRFFEKK